MRHESTKHDDPRCVAWDSDRHNSRVVEEGEVQTSPGAATVAARPTAGTAMGLTFRFDLRLLDLRRWHGLGVDVWTLMSYGGSHDVVSCMTSLCVK